LTNNEGKIPQSRKYSSKPSTSLESAGTVVHQPAMGWKQKVQMQLSQAERKLQALLFCMMLR
jgi:hypothetical protein